MDPETYQLLFGAFNKQIKFKLLNTYRGVPVTNMGSLLEFHANQVTVNTRPFQLVTARIQRATYLIIDDRVIKGDLITASLNYEKMTLGNLEICNPCIGQRKYIRAEPEDPIKAQITSPRFAASVHNVPRWFNSSMANLSIHGATILFHKLLVKQMPVYVSDPISLRFELLDPATGEISQLELNAIIRNITPFDDKMIRIGLETFPYSNVENFLSRCVAQTQKIIIQELKDRVEREKPLAIS